MKAQQIKGMLDLMQAAEILQKIDKDISNSHQAWVMPYKSAHSVLSLLALNGAAWLRGRPSEIEETHEEYAKVLAATTEGLEECITRARMPLEQIQGYENRHEALVVWVSKVSVFDYMGETPPVEDIPGILKQVEELEKDLEKYYTLCHLISKEYKVVRALKAKYIELFSEHYHDVTPPAA